MQTSYHPAWQDNRLNFMINKYGAEFFRGKTVLELAPYNGYIGGRLRELGAIVTFVEGREENIKLIQENNPGSTIIHANLDTPDWPFGEFDIIIDFGLYYHLEKYHIEHLANAIKNSEILFFETIVLDSDKCEVRYVKENPEYDDQSMSTQGCRPSTSYLEKTMDWCGKSYTKYSDACLTAGGQKYDWQDGNTESDGKIPSFDFWHRRFWIVGGL